MTTLNFELFISLDRTLRMLVSSKLWKIFIFCPEKRWVNNLPGVCLRTDLPFQCISMLVPHNSAFSGVGTAVAFAQFFFSSENLLEGFCMTLSIPRTYLSVGEFADSGLMHWDRRQRASFCLQGVNLPSSIGDYLSPAAAELQDPNHFPCWSQRQEKHSLMPRNYLMLVWVKMLKSCCANCCLLILLNEKGS